MLQRRAFMAGLGSPAACPLALKAQQPSRQRRIGMLNSFSDDPVANNLLMETFHALSQLGWERGRNVEVIERWANSDPDWALKQARELVALQPDIVVAVANLATDAMHNETRVIPIVFVNTFDPVVSGFVPSLARPGGNMTGITNTERAFGGKLLSLLKRVAPRIRLVAGVFNPDTAPEGGLYHLGSFNEAARSMGVEPIAAEVRSDADLEAVIASLGREHGGLLVLPDPFMVTHRGTVIGLCLRHGVPTIADTPTFAKEGGLINYGPNFREHYRRAAFYVDRILRGAKPGDLPIELPTRYSLAINLKTAKAIGLDLSPDMISIADEVVE
jgi:putative tryptophan/tyrosine transport system substrate-binding protein